MTAAFVPNQECQVSADGPGMSVETRWQLLFRNKRIGVARLILVMLLGGLAIFGSLRPFGDSWYAVFVFEVVLINVCSEVLVSQLPCSLSVALKRTCIRQDGSWSKSREQIELAAIGRLRWDLRDMLLLVLIPTTILTCLVDQSIVPVRLGFSGLASLRFSEDESRANLQE